MSIITKLITTKQTYSIRQLLLRQGKPITSCMFKGDDLPTTFHLGAYSENNLIGVVSLFKKQHKNFTIKNQYQLRGMGVLANFQGKGVGKLLVKKAEASILKKGSNFIWMDAREKATHFYKKLDYYIVGELFNIPDVGLHHVMTKHL